MDKPTLASQTDRLPGQRYNKLKKVPCAINAIKSNISLRASQLHRTLYCVFDIHILVFLLLLFNLI